MFDKIFAVFADRAFLEMLLRVALLTGIGAPVVFVLSRWTNRAALRRYTAQQAMIANKLVLYGGLALIAISTFQQLGFRIDALLGAAGIVGIALGFASQTSVSNVISGLFMMAEQPFVIGDVITVGTTTGQVLSIDLISIKLRTFDNRLVRIPNETIVKSELTNITHFPIRRVDVQIGVAYKEDIGRVRETLLDLAKRNPLCLMEPEPLVIFNGFGASSIDFLLAVWVEKSNYLTLKNTIQEEIKNRFDVEAIEIPFPHVSLYAGSATQPFPVRLMRETKVS